MVNQKTPSFIHRLSSRMQAWFSFSKETRQEELGTPRQFMDPELASSDSALRRLGAGHPSSLRRPESTCPDEDVLWSYLACGLKGKGKQAVINHLNQCDTCRAIVAEAVRHQPDTDLQDPAPLKTQPPVIDDLLLHLPEQTQTRMSSSGTAYPRTWWKWGVGLSAPVALAIGFLFFVTLARPNVEMVVYWDSGHTLRSSSSLVPLHSGQSLASGDRLRAEIIGRRDGFVYCFLWSASQGGQFLFPSSFITQGNIISKGARLVVPGDGFWIVDQSAGGEEVLYLLFSVTPIDILGSGNILEELNRASRSSDQVEKRLSKYFSIEQKMTYQHQ